jgi:hypothetical protein
MASCGRWLDRWWPDFDRIWFALSERGACDAMGGMEYRRVHAEWVAAGQPVQVVDFIVRRANVSGNDLLT